VKKSRWGFTYIHYTSWTYITNSVFILIILLSYCEICFVLPLFGFSSIVFILRLRLDVSGAKIPSENCHLFVRKPILALT